MKKEKEEETKEKNTQSTHLVPRSVFVHSSSFFWSFLLVLFISCLIVKFSNKFNQYFFVLVERLTI